MVMDKSSSGVHNSLISISGASINPKPSGNNSDSNSGTNLSSIGERWVPNFTDYQNHMLLVDNPPYLTDHKHCFCAYQSLFHNDSYVRDKQMQVTIAYNHFGEGLIQRIPRCRRGKAYGVVGVRGLRESQPFLRCKF